MKLSQKAIKAIDLAASKWVEVAAENAMAHGRDGAFGRDTRRPELDHWRITMDLEAYCVDSGYPVRPGAGDRCRAHGAMDVMCFQSLREPRCIHPLWPDGANGSDRCPECGSRSASIHLER